MEMKNELVVCQGLTKVYGSLKALDNLDLTVRARRLLSSCSTGFSSRPAAR